MFRLIIALGVATVLLPAETITGKPDTTKKVENVEVSTYDTFSAAHSIYSDVTSFCDRNEETCITARALATSAVSKVRSGLNQLAQDTHSTHSELDPIKTSSVTK